MRERRIVSKAGKTLRTCLGCREERDKSELVRLVSSPAGVVVIDYKGNLPGRGSYICPDESCVRDAFLKKQVSRAFKDARINGVEEFLSQLRERILERVSSLVSLSRKAGKALDGREAVEKGLERGSIKLLLLADDISSGSLEEMTEKCRRKGIKYYRCFSKDEMGALFGKGERSAAGITDETFSSLVEKELGRLRDLGSLASGGEING